MKEKIDLNSDAQSLRKKFGLDAYSPLDILSIVASNNELTLIFYPFHDNVSGVCIKTQDAQIIAVNSLMTDGRQRFTIAHELYHLYFQKEVGKFVCGMEMNVSKDPIEREADIFASYFIAPYNALREYITVKLGKQKGDVKIEDVVHIEQTFKMSRQAILCRLLDEGYLNQKQADEMKTRVKISAIQLGYDTPLYEPSKEAKMRFTLGRYVLLARKLHMSQKISEGKFNELMMQAFRSDLVYMDDTLEENYYD